MSGFLFWCLTSYAFVGLVSGVALGPEWLRHANDDGIRHVEMLIPGVVFLGIAVTIRVALLRRAIADKICSSFSLLAWAAVFGAAAQSGAGWIGRWPGSWLLHGIHGVAIDATLLLLSLVAIMLLRMAMKSDLPVFKVPGTVLAVASGAVVFLILGYYLFGITSSLAWVVIASLLSAAGLRIARLTPHRPKEPQQWQVTRPRHS